MHEGQSSTAAVLIHPPVFCPATSLPLSACLVGIPQPLLPPTKRTTTTTAGIDILPSSLGTPSSAAKDRCMLRRHQAHSRVAEDTIDEGWTKAWERLATPLTAQTVQKTPQLFMLSACSRSSVLSGFLPPAAPLHAARSRHTGWMREKDQLQCLRLSF